MISLGFLAAGVACAQDVPELEQPHGQNQGRLENLTVQGEQLQSQVEQLQSQVASLELQVEQLEENSGSSAGVWFWSLLFGLAGGAAAYLILSLYNAKYGRSNDGQHHHHHRQHEHGREEEIRKPLRQAETQGRTTQQSSHPRPQQVQQQRQQQNPQQQQRLQQQQRQPQEQHQQPQPQQKRQPQRQQTEPQPRTDRQRIAYGQLMIPEANLLIIEDGDLTDAPGGQPFQFDINETKGTATYTFAPAVAGQVISNLSSYEKFLEPFDFNPQATKVGVVRPGELRRKDGYWEVERRITVKLY